MNISEPFIRRPVGTSLLAIGLFVLGMVAYQFLPVAPLPRVDFPSISVGAGLPGADPSTVASSLAAPLEKRLGQIAGVTEMISSSTMGGCNISLQFDLSRKIDGAARDVQAAINAAAGDLPINLPGPPTYRKVNPADAPVMILSMTSDTMPLTDVFEYANNIVGQKLSQVEGVSQASISGAAKSAVRVQVNPAALASTGISLDQVRTMLGQVNVDTPKGSLNGTEQSYEIASNDQLTNAEDYQNLILTVKKGVPIKLNSLGNVEQSVENKLVSAWAGTNRAVLLFVFKQADANVIATADRVKAVLPEIEKWLPPTIHLAILSDRTITIRSSVEEVQFALMLSIALVIMVIFLFLRRFWPTFIASAAVPMALAGTFALMYLLHYSVDNLSLMAITISVGFVVDDAIVVIENVYRFIERGESPLPAALRGARQIGFTVVSMCTSLIAVFIPLLFMSGLIGRLFHEFAVTLSLAILVSGVISLTLTPMLCSRFLRPESSYGPPGWFYRTDERIFLASRRLYEHGLRWVLRHQYFMLAVTVLTCFATIYLYIKVPKGFFPQQDTGMLFGGTQAAQDISFAAMLKLQGKVTKIILEDKAIETAGSFIGSPANTGRYFITLKPLKERKESAEAVIARLRRKTAGIEGINLILQSPQDIRVGGRATRSQFQYALQSADLDELNKWSNLLLEKMRSMPELRDADSDQQTGGVQANVVVDRDAASRFGISVSAIDNVLYDAFGQRQVSTIYEQYSQHHVVMEVDPAFLQDPSALQKIYVTASNGPPIPLATLAKFDTGNAFLSVNHQGQFPAVTLSFNLAPGVSLGAATDLVRTATDELKMPTSVQGSFQGTAQVFQASLSTMPLLILAAVLTVYIVLGMLYESLVHPLTILSTLPSAGVGALLALMVAGFDLSLVSFIGIILLMGIVKKNAIMMVDFAIDAERNEGLPPEEAIYQAGMIRFRPIMMTTMCALLGSVPLAMGLGTGSELRQPLGIAVVGGLILSQTLTLYTTPVIYLSFEKARIWVRNRFRRSAPVLVPATSE